MKRPSHALWLGGVLIVGILLRVWGLPARELSSYDEGGHWRMGYAPAAAFRACVADLACGDVPSREGVRAAILRHGFPDTYFGAHHGYVAFESLAMAVAGIRDDAGFWVSAFWGSMTLIVVFRLGTVLGSATAGLCAAALLAVSPNHVFYSRAGLAQATSVFFVYASFFCLLRPVTSRARLRSCFTGGVLLGYGLATHYNLFWAIPYGVAVVTVLSRLEGGVGTGRTLLAFVAGTAVFPLLFEGITRAAVPHLAGTFPGTVPYFREIAHQFTINTGGYSHSRSTPFFYAIHWIRTEGILFTAAALLLAVCFAAAFLRMRSAAAFRKAVLAGLVLVPHLLYAPLPLKGARTLLVAIPAAVLCASWWIARRPPFPRAVILSALLAGMVPMTVAVVSGRGPYKAVLAEISRRGGSPVTVDDYPVVQTYSGRDDVLVAQTGNRSWRESLAAVRRAHPGAQYLIAVRKDGRYGFEDPVWSERFGIVREVVGRGTRPLLSVPFGHPLEFDYVDEAVRRDRLFGLSQVEYAVDVFDLDGL